MPWREGINSQAGRHDDQTGRMEAGRSIVSPRAVGGLPLARHSPDRAWQTIRLAVGALEQTRRRHGAGPKAELIALKLTMTNCQAY